MIRHATVPSPEDLSILDAANEGAEAGKLGIAASLNPYSDPALPHYQAWEKARLLAHLYKHTRRTA